jgi:hypothetical protein
MLAVYKNVRVLFVDIPNAWCLETSVHNSEHNIVKRDMINNSPLQEIISSKTSESEGVRWNACGVWECLPGINPTVNT